MSSAERQPNAPSATMTRTSAPVSYHSAVSHGAHVDRSTGVGAFAGGAHRTAATTRVALSVRPSAASTLIGEFANPARCIAAYSTSPDRSPVKTRPVRLAPFAAGARPTTISRGRCGTPARNRSAPIRLVGERPPLDMRRLLAPLNQPRAGAAHRHLGVELCERFNGPGHRGHLRLIRRHRRAGSRGIAGPTGTRRHRGVEERAGTRVGEIHRSTVHEWCTSAAGRCP